MIQPSSLVIWLTLISSLVATTLAAEWASSALAAVPLAVKSPYLNIWTETMTVDGKAHNSTGDVWPTLWNRHPIGWSGLIRVDGRPYRWLGILDGVNETANTVSGSVLISATRTRLSSVAGPIQLTVTFLSPIEPSDWVKQSLPFSYVSIDIVSMDGLPHDVQLMCSITGELLSDNLLDDISFNTTQTSRSIFHALTKISPSRFVESKDQAQDGTLYLATPATQSGLSWQTGNCSDLSSSFAGSGTLSNTSDSSNSRSIGNGTYLVCTGLAINLGSIANSSSPALWALGFVRDPTIRASTSDGTEVRIPYFRTKYSSIDPVIDDFLADFSEALKRAQTLDIKILEDGNATSPAYADLLAFSARLVFSGMDITVLQTSSTALDNVRVYLKDIGRSSRINPVEALLAVFPAITYFNSTLAGRLLEPLLDYETAGVYHNNYAASDLGSNYPDARGNANESPLSLEASASMIIMALYHARKSGDGTLCQRHYNLLKPWADYLVANVLDKNSFSTSDLKAPKGDVNLALGAIVGIQAMAGINTFLEPQGASASDTQSYISQAQTSQRQWRALAWSQDHLLGTFDSPSSWSLIYNGYADKILKTSILDDEILRSQDAYYASQIPTGMSLNYLSFQASESGLLAPAYGFPYHSNLLVARSDWTMLTAAAVNDTTVRDFLIDGVHKRAIWANTINPWPTLYWANNASTSSGQASPAHGGNFAIVAHNLPDQAIRVDASRKISPQGTVNRTSKRTIAGAAAGGTIGGLALIALLVAGFLWYRRGRRSRGNVQEAKDSVIAMPYDLSNGTANLSTTETTAAVSDTSKVSPKPMAPLRPKHLVAQDTASNSTGSTSNTSASHTTLRDEVDELRREMAALRQNQAVLEAPPGYSEERNV